MNKLYLIPAFILLYPCLVCAQEITSDKEEYKAGECVHLTYAGQPGDVVQWTVLNPWPEPEMKEVRTRYGVDFIIDPPAKWSGRLRVQVIAYDAEKRVRAIQTVDVKVGNGANPPPGPNPPDPQPSGEYTGPDQYGVGKVAWTNAPKSAAERLLVADVYKQAGNSLFGNPQKGVYFQNQTLNNDPDKNALLWIKLNMPQGWAKWSSDIDEAFRTLQNKEIERTGMAMNKGIWQKAMFEVSDALRVGQ